MSWVDVDVIAKAQNVVGGVEDRRLKAFQGELERQQAFARALGVASEKLLIKDTVNVFDMVSRIVSNLHGRQIRRLRIFGHGSPNTIQMGPFKYTRRGLEALSQSAKIDQQDYDSIMQVVLTPNLKYELLNRANLEKLRGHFAPRGWVELQTCRLMGGDGDGSKLIEGLSELWNVAVQASDARQFGGGGFEGSVWQATPGTKAKKIRPQGQSTSITGPALKSVLAANNPLRKALEGLIAPDASKAQGAWRTSISTYKPIKAGSFVVGKTTTDMTVTSHVFDAATTARDVWRHPVKAAAASILGSKTTFSHMPRGTMYSDLATGKTYRVDALGMHVETGTMRSVASRRESSLSTLNRSMDPLRATFDSLKPKSSGYRMAPGTSYSSITTGKTYVVTSAGSHLQTGAAPGFIRRPGTGQERMALRAQIDPLRAAFRRLGG